MAPEKTKISYPIPTDPHRVSRLILPSIPESPRGYGARDSDEDHDSFESMLNAFPQPPTGRPASPGDSNKKHDSGGWHRLRPRDTSLTDPAVWFKNPRPAPTPPTWLESPRLAPVAPSPASPPSPPAPAMQLREKKSMSNMLRRAAKKSTLSLRNLASKMEPKDKGKAKEKAIEPLQEQKKPQGKQCCPNFVLLETYQRDDGL